MQVLVALAQAGGEIVTRDDRPAPCWEGRIVGEDAISKVIARLGGLTETLGRESWTMETVTKVGYRLLPRDGAAADPLALSQSAPPRRRLLIGAGALTLGAAAAGGLWWRYGRRSVSDAARVLYDKGRD